MKVHHPFPFLFPLLIAAAFFFKQPDWTWSGGFSRFFASATAANPAEASNPEGIVGRVSLTAVSMTVKDTRPTIPDHKEFTVLLANPADPYYPLAREIAQAEALPVASNLKEALSRKSTFLIWVVSPTGLSDRVLVDFSTALLENSNTVSVGIISGRTIDEARALWLRAAQAQDRPAFAANGTYPTAGVPRGRIRAYDGENIPQDLTRETLQEDLRQAGYLSFTGHGGSRYWKLDEGLQFTAQDIPNLPATVIGTASCQTFRLWDEGSIALAFAGQGAAAYAGFPYSPNEGYLIGEFDGLPFRFTWPGFPIGHAVQVQNHGTLQVFARFPYYFLLGDPRLALRDDPPYRMTSDRREGRVHVLSYAGAPAGLIPVRIPGGAAYRFVEISDVAAASSGDRFYNARLQMADMGEDKLVLFAHPGGDFTIRLLPSPSLAWLAADLLGDSLDHTLVYVLGTGGDWISLGFTLIPGLWLAWSAKREQLSSRTVAAALLAGAFFAGLHSLYAYTRVGEITITSKPVEVSLPGLAATFLLCSLGAALFIQVRSRRLKILSLLIAAFPALAPALFSIAVVGLFNIVYARPALGIGVYNYALAQMALIAFTFEVLLFWLAFTILKSVLIKTNVFSY